MRRTSQSYALKRGAAAPIAHYGDELPEVDTGQMLDDLRAMEVDDMNIYVLQGTEEEANKIQQQAKFMVINLMKRFPAAFRVCWEYPKLYVIRFA